MKHEAEDDILGPIPEELRRHLHYTVGHNYRLVDASKFYHASAAVIRDRVSRYWLSTRERFAASQSRRVHYLSLEFLLGRSLNNAIQNMGLEESLRVALHDLRSAVGRSGRRRT